MDTGKGRVEILEVQKGEHLQAAKQALEEKYPNHGGWFRVGETIELRGSMFRVKAVKPTQIILKLLPRQKN